LLGVCWARKASAVDCVLSEANNLASHRPISNMKPSRKKMKQRNIDWMIECNNQTPIEFFRFIQPTHKARAIEKYGKILDEAIRLCKAPDKQSKLKNIKETVNCNSDWDVWLVEKRAMSIRGEIHETNTEVHRELNVVVRKRVIEPNEESLRKRQKPLDEEQENEEYDNEAESSRCIMRKHS
ncbi:12915_t:CDS:2, partial [Ambispora gerdemannii]